MKGEEVEICASLLFYTTARTLSDTPLLLSSTACAPSRQLVVGCWLPPPLVDARFCSTRNKEGIVRYVIRAYYFTLREEL